MLLIRKLQKKDAIQVARLIPQLTKNIVEPKALEKRIATLSNQKQSQFLVAEFNGQVVGFAGLVCYLIPSKGMIGWIEELVVDKIHRRQGVATQLLQAILTLAQQENISVIKLTSNGPEASKLYEKLGFIKKDHQYFSKKLHL